MFGATIPAQGVDLGSGSADALRHANLRFQHAMLRVHWEDGDEGYWTGSEALLGKGPFKANRFGLSEMKAAKAQWGQIAIHVEEACQPEELAGFVGGGL